MARRVFTPSPSRPIVIRRAMVRAERARLIAPMSALSACRRRAAHSATTRRQPRKPCCLTCRHDSAPSLAGFLYLAVVLDAWSRRIVGWAFSANLKTRVVLDALDMALVARKPDNVVIIRIVGG
jgi:transposase InsO family protein